MSNGPLYAMGGAHPNAMRGLATGNRADKPAEREQVVLTPDFILDICRATWDGEIALDPCGAPGHDFATTTYRLPEQNGLELPWTDKTFVNPPFKDLKKWLAKSVEEHGAGAYEQILVFPVRPNRQWWVDFVRNVQAIAWLKPFPFKGHKQAFPAPCVLTYTGFKVGSFVRASKKHSTAVTYPLETKLS